MVHAVRARGPGTGGVGEHSGRAPGTAGTRSPEDLADSPDGAARPRALGGGDRTSLLRTRGPKRTPTGRRGDQHSPAFFSAPPGRQARRPAASAAAGLGWDTAPTGARRPALRPSGDRTSRGRSPPRTPRRTRTHNARARRGAIFASPLLGKGRPGRRAASGWQRARRQVPIRLGRAGTGGGASPGVGEDAGPRPEGMGYVADSDCPQRPTVCLVHSLRGALSLLQIV
ncbi:translation initiation factor IF-2-like [Psammomys obesus]|uniref:translation initiation factor IF-2-like n=1 Tax=Psammomys obesus TaxID=48139 RepID=UPI0024536B97|nr:translation initiation factor IF-2-like [Psammomys obesus]